MLDLTRGDRRLFMRLGNLLQHGVSCTEAVLAEVQHEPALRKLLLDRRLTTLDAENLAALVAAHECTEIGLAWHVEAGGDGFHVLVLEDELDNPLLAQDAVAAEGPVDWQQPVSSLLPSLGAAVRKPVEGLLAAQADDQRAAALEQLRYAAPPLAVVAELMPLVLADSAEGVRERGIALLTAVGAHPLVVDLIRALQRQDDTALLRLARQLPPSLPAQQADLLIAALLALLTQTRLSAGMLAVACAIAPGLAGHRGCERFLELACLHAGQLSLTPCVRAMQEAARGRVDACLRGLLGQSPELDARLIVLLAHPAGDGPADLLERGVHLLISPEEEPRERMSLAQALCRLDASSDCLSAALVARAGDFTHARDSTVFWLLAELARNGQMTTAQADQLAERTASILRAGEGPHMVAILDQTLPCLLPCGAQAQAQLVEPLAEMVVRFRDQRSGDLVHSILGQLGAPAVTVLWTLVADHPQPPVRAVAARVLPRILATLANPQRLDGLARLLAAADTERHHQTRITIMHAAAQLGQHLSEDPADLTAGVDRRCENLGVEAIEAQALIAAGPFISAERRAAVVDKLVRLLQAELPQASTAEEIDPATEEITYILDPQLGAHTDLVPRILRGLRELGQSDHLPRQLFRRICMALITQWQQVARWQVIWGPGNVHELARHMALIAADARCPEGLRKQVAAALAPRITLLPIAGFIVRILAAAAGASCAGIAETCCQRLIRAATRNEFADDELGELCLVLAGLLALPDLGNADARLRSQLVSLITTHRQHCDKRGRERLVFLRSELPAHLSARLEWA